jgi:hypothetical protein
MKQGKGEDEATTGPCPKQVLSKFGALGRIRP